MCPAAPWTSTPVCLCLREEREVCMLVIDFEVLEILKCWYVISLASFPGSAAHAREPGNEASYKL